MDSHSSPTLQQQEPYRNWLDLPKDVSVSIFLRLGAIDILTSVQRVCSTWRTICKDPSMWREIDMNYYGDDWDRERSLVELCRHAVDRSCGGLINIKLEYFGDDDLLQYIADRSPRLKVLRLISCYNITDEGLCEAVAKLALLEELEISYCNLSKKSLDAAGNDCPLLKSLKLNVQGFKLPHIECNAEALAIAEKMPRLCQLQIFGNKLTNEGLQAILDGCQHLESLDLRQCFNVNLEGDLKRICSERIKDLRCPYDSTDDYPFDAEIPDIGSSDEDYPYGFSDIDFMSDDDDYYELSGGSDISDFEDFLF
ncbi:F-box protein SKIP19-like [Euphorbia lathyris]|uniref:F-box protein SKIP19-like n=1 Tax=Euphorbia lathyris TaxID=212925 RepID=UPI0033139AA8